VPTGHPPDSADNQAAQGHFTIVVTAPTSRIGSQLLGHLVGHAELRVVARDPARLREDVREQTDVIIGSHGDPARS
jgi:hypothetical protein